MTGARSSSEARLDAGWNPCRPPDFEEFWEAISVRLALEESAVVRSSRLHEDLGFDAIRRMELDVVMRALGAEIPERCWRQMIDAEDVHFWFLQFRQTST